MIFEADLKRLPPRIIADLRVRYAEPQRRYHVWRHIEALHGWWAQRRSALRDPEAVLLAILFHDAVYDPQRSDNEAKSADLLASAPLPDTGPDTRSRAVSMIEATARHAIPDRTPADEVADLAEFLDVDLSILGAPEPMFDAYEAAIRAEYGFVSDELFREGRRRILSAFMDRPSLYFSDWGRSLFEGQARVNLERSIAALS